MRVPRKSFFIKCYHYLRTFYIGLSCWHEICFIWVFPGKEGEINLWLNLECTAFLSTMHNSRKPKQTRPGKCILQMPYIHISILPQQRIKIVNILTRNSQNSYVTTAGGVQQSELINTRLNVLTSLKSRSRSVMVYGSGQGVLWQMMYEVSSA